MSSAGAGTPLQLIIGDKRYSSWSMRAALAVSLTGEACEESLIVLNQPDSKQRMLAHSPAGKVPVLKCEHGVIADSLAIGEYLAERFPQAGLWPADPAQRALARSACAQMHSGFMALRSHMPMDVQHDAPLASPPAKVEADIRQLLALWQQCQEASSGVGPFLFGSAGLVDAFFAPVAVRLRTYHVALPAFASAYVETLYQWPAFESWRIAGLEET